jgi:membrane protease YdiL (CAAX protease family)
MLISPDRFSTFATKKDKMIDIISGFVAAVVIIILSRVLSKYFTTKLYAASILVAIAFIYVGFSLKNNPNSLIILEIVVALILFFVAVIGYTRNNSLIAYGIIFHGVWDFAHHNRFLINTDIPVYWPTFCSIIDIITGIYFLLIFQKQAKSLLHD